MKLVITNEYEITSYDGDCGMNYGNDLEISVFYNVTPPMPTPTRSFVRNVLQKNKETLTGFARELHTYIESQLPNLKTGRNKPHGFRKDDNFYMRAMSRWRLEVMFITKPNFVLPPEETFIKAFIEGIERDA